MNSNQLLSDTDIQRIKVQYNIPDAEVKIEMRSNTPPGKNTYVLWVNPEALPAGFKFQDIADNYNTNSGGNGNAYLLSADSTTSSAISIIANLLVVLIVVFM